MKPEAITKRAERISARITRINLVLGRKTTGKDLKKALNSELAERSAELEFLAQKLKRLTQA